MAHWLDWKTGVQAVRLWTDEEIALLLNGKPVPYRTAEGCAIKLRKLGVRNGPRHYLVRSPYTPPIPVSGKIPWPAWRRRAHLMRVEGYRVTEIARILDLDVNSVRGALYPEYHENERQKRRRRRQKPANLAKEQERYRPHDRENEKLRRCARDEWRAAGGDPRTLERFYRAFDCL